MATAAILIAGLLGALFLLPRLALAVLIAVLAALAAFEWARLCGVKGILTAAYAVLVVAVYGALFGIPGGVDLAVAGVFWLLVVPAWLWAGVKVSQRGLLLAAGPVMIAPAAVVMVVLPPLELLVVLVLVWVADIAAYFAGQAWGSHKLAPATSPGKTWEGAVAGLFGALAWAIICGSMAEKISWAPLLGSAALLASISIVGDLFESAAKRQAGMKDSGTLLPGHGGLLDRVDSALAVLPLAAVLLPFVKGQA